MCESAYSSRWLPLPSSARASAGRGRMPCTALGVRSSACRRYAYVRITRVNTSGVDSTAGYHKLLTCQRNISKGAPGTVSANGGEGTRHQHLQLYYLIVCWCKRRRLRRSIRTALIRRTGVIPLRRTNYMGKRPHFAEAPPLYAKLKLRSSPL